MIIVRIRKLFRVGRALRNPKIQMLVLVPQGQPKKDQEVKRGLGGQTWRDSVQKGGGMGPIAAAEALLSSTRVPSEVKAAPGLSM